jgi:hypothetical protein
MAPGAMKRNRWWDGAIVQSQSGSVELRLRTTELFGVQLAVAALAENPDHHPSTSGEEKWVVFVHCAIDRADVRRFWGKLVNHESSALPHLQADIAIGCCKHQAR